MADELDPFLDARESAYLRNVTPYFEEFIEKIVSRVRKDVYSDLDRGVLDPQKAVQAWIEVHTADKILQKFHREINITSTRAEDGVKRR